MRIDIRPIMMGFARSRTGALLVGIQIAIALALVVNAVYIAKQRVDKIDRPTGIDLQNTFVISTAGFADDFHYMPTVQTDLNYLRGIPGVVAATTISSIPLYIGTNIPLTTRPNDHGAPRLTGYFDVDEQGLRALGTTLIAGRNFRADEVASNPNPGLAPQLIITRHLAEELFPGSNAVGRNVYLPGSTTPSRVIGVIDRMLNASLNSSWVDDVALGPERPLLAPSQSYYYLVRTDPGQRDRIMRAVEYHLSTSNPHRVVDWVQPLIHFARVSYAFDTLMASFLAFLTAILICIAALGVFGLSTYNVTRRIKQIGVRRAVGATRADILGYFLVENAMITIAGVILGCALTLGIGYWLSVDNRLPRLDLYYLVGGIVVVILVGQLAALQPARRAAAVPPSVATRTV